MLKAYFTDSKTLSEDNGHQTRDQQCGRSCPRGPLARFLFELSLFRSSSNPALSLQFVMRERSVAITTCVKFRQKLPPVAGEKAPLACQAEKSKVCQCSQKL